MSDRSIIVSDFVYCGECTKVLRKHFESLCKLNLTHPCGYLHTIFKEYWTGAAEFELENEGLLSNICKEICHTIRLVLLSEDGGTKMYILRPNKLEIIFSLHDLSEENINRNLRSGDTRENSG